MRRPRARRSRGSNGACGASQTKCRGGWSGGGRTSPSATRSSCGCNCSCVAGLTARPNVDGPSCRTFNMQIATSGQSRQSLLFCLSGQHGISAVMSDIWLIPVNEDPAAAGVASGAIVRPAVTRTASSNLNNWRTFMSRQSHKGRVLKRSPCSQLHQREIGWLIVHAGLALHMERGATTNIFEAATGSAQFAHHRRQFASSSRGPPLATADHNPVR